VVVYRGVLKANVEHLLQFAKTFGYTILDLLRLVFEPALLGTSTPPEVVQNNVLDHRDELIVVLKEANISLRQQVTELTKRLGE
jgi:hypothetical protein